MGLLRAPGYSGSSSQAFSSYIQGLCSWQEKTLVNFRVSQVL